MKAKNKIWIYPLIVMGFLLLLGTSNKKDENLPDYARNLNSGGTGNKEMITICHMPCSPAQKTLMIPIQALAAHLNHGDQIGACGPTTNVEYVISRSPDKSDPIYVDDILRLFVNGNLVFYGTQSGGCCPPMPPIHFFANTGDILRVQAQDANRCYSIEDLWLQKTDGNCLIHLTGPIYGPNCDSETPYQIFFDQTFRLP